MLIQLDLHLTLNIRSQPALLQPHQKTQVQIQSWSLLLCQTLLFACISSDFPFLCFGVIQLCLIELLLTSFSGKEETWLIVFVLSTVIFNYSFLKSIISNSLATSEQGWTKLNLNGKLYVNSLLDQSLGKHQPPLSWKLLERPREPPH